MEIHAGVVYSVFGVTIFIGTVLLVRAIISVRRHLLSYYDEFECPDSDQGRRRSGSTEIRLVLSADGLEGDDVPPPLRVSLPESAGGGEEGGAKGGPPLSLAQLDRACPAVVLAQSTAGGESDTQGNRKEGTTGGSPPCSVCLDDMEPGQLVRTLPVCGHSYHDAYVWVGRCGRDHDGWGGLGRPRAERACLLVCKLIADGRLSVLCASLLLFRADSALALVPSRCCLRVVVSVYFFFGSLFAGLPCTGA